MRRDTTCSMAMEHVFAATVRIIRVDMSECAKTQGVVGGRVSPPDAHGFGVGVGFGMPAPDPCLCFLMSSIVPIGILQNLPQSGYQQLLILLPKWRQAAQNRGFRVSAIERGIHFSGGNFRLRCAKAAQTSRRVVSAARRSFRISGTAELFPKSVHLLPRGVDAQHCSIYQKVSPVVQ